MTALSNQLAHRAHELLADGEWHNYERVLQELMKVVPPGIALRRAIETNRMSREGNRKRGNVLGVRRASPSRAPSKEHLIEHGKRNYARLALKTKAYEIDRPGLPGSTAEIRELNRQRKIRMVRVPRAVAGDLYRAQRDRLEFENQVLRDQVKMLRDFLVSIGHGADADRIAPES